MHLDALCLANELDVAGPGVDFSVLPYFDPVARRDENAGQPYVSDIMLPAPFEDQNFRLRAGIHLHWSVPDGLTRLVQGDDGSTAIPAIPNRWLVSRSVDGVTDGEWVIESDFLSDDNVTSVAYPVEGPGRPYRRLGRWVPLPSWTRPDDPSAYLPKLTAVGSGDPLFAARYANSYSVLGFHDPTYAGVPPQGLRYDVVGWFADLSQDPAATLGTDDDWLARCQSEYGWMVTDPPGPPERVACYAQLTFAATELVASSLLTQAAEETGVFIGNTPTEALAAHLGAVLDGTRSDQVEELLEALAFATELEAQPLDLDAGLREARHTATFQDVPAGTVWTIRRQDDEDATPEQRQLRERLAVPHQLSDQLNLLNTAQADVDRAGQGATALRQQLFADWYKYQLCSYPYDAGLDSYPDPDEVMFFLRTRMAYLAQEGSRARAKAQHLNEVRTAVDGELTALNLRAADARCAYLLQPTPAPPYQLPNEPAVLFTGSAATPSGRHGHDGKLHPDGLLACGFTTEEHPALDDPEEVRALRADAGAAAARLPEPNFAIITWTEQPWNPVMLQWEVEFFPATSGNNLDPRDRAYHENFITRNYTLPVGDVELQPTQNIPAKAANVYAGTTILSPSARPVLSTRILDYLQGTVLPAYNAEVAPPVTPEEFLADPEPVLTWYDEHGTDSQLLLLTRIYRHLAANEDSNLSAALSGFNDALLMRRLTRQLPVADPLGYPPYQDFAALVAGVVGDQTRYAPQPLSDFNPIRAGALRVLRLQIVDSFGVTLDVDVSNLGTTTQLRVPGHPEWVAMPPRLAQPARLTVNWLDGEDSIRQMNGLPDTSPICGWLVPGNLSDSLGVYAADGTATGELYALSDPERPALAQWRALPGTEFIPVEQIPNARLRAVVRELRDDGPDALAVLLGRLDDTLRQIEPEDYAQRQGLALLMGRPLAVVRAEVTLELMGWPAVHQDWNVFRQDMRRATRETNQFPLVRFPVRLGEHHQLGDGVLGYWLEDAAQRLIPGFHDVRDEDNPLRQAIDVPAQYATLLIDPRGTVHATAGVLPTRTLQIPADMYRQALDSMAVAFLTAPLLADGDLVAVPLPNEPGYSWSWQEQTREGWTERTSLPQPDARIPERPVLREGWLTLRPAPSEVPGSQYRRGTHDSQD
jgi:hypothetical protein